MHCTINFPWEISNPALSAYSWVSSHTEGADIWLGQRGKFIYEMGGGETMKYWINSAVKLNKMLARSSEAEQSLIVNHMLGY